MAYTIVSIVDFSNTTFGLSNTERIESSWLQDVQKTHRIIGIRLSFDKDLGNTFIISILISATTV